MTASAEELLERITEIGGRGAGASEEELDELVTLLGSRAWTDRSVDRETGWYDLAPTPLDLVHVADEAQKALAALGGRALVRAAARYDGMPDEARERARRLFECASLDALAELGAAERAMLASKRCA